MQTRKTVGSNPTAISNKEIEMNIKNIKKQKGYTVFELIICGGVLAAVASAVGIIYVAVHFIAKFW